MAAAINRNPELFGAVCLHDVWLDTCKLPTGAVVSMIDEAQDFFIEVRKDVCQA